MNAVQQSIYCMSYSTYSKTLNSFQNIRSETAICLSVSYLLASPQIAESRAGKELTRSSSPSICFVAAWEIVLYLAGATKSAPNPTINNSSPRSRRSQGEIAHTATLAETKTDCELIDHVTDRGRTLQVFSLFCVLANMVINRTINVSQSKGFVRINIAIAKQIQGWKMILSPLLPQTSLAEPSLWNCHI